MATKHVFDKPEGLVDKALRGAIAVNPALRLYRPHKVLYDSTHSNSKVAIMAGGGAGHEPGQAGLVGKGMLAAAISGDIFASPSAAQICSGIDLTNTDAGIIFIINNYTGDQLNFGLAAEKARAALAYSGNKTSGGVECVTIADDVAVGRAKGGLVGRRGLGMNPFSCKVLGAASERGLSVKQIKNLGDTLIANSVTIGTSLDHCHVPGRSKVGEEWGALPDGSCEIGMGIHNEPGVRRLDQTPPPDQLIGEMLKYMLDPNDADRHYIDFDKDDAPIIFINNLGGLSNLELFAIADETIEQLDKTYGLHPSRVYANAYMTSLNAPGFGITLVKHKPVSASAGVDLLDLLDDPTDAYSWTGVSSGWPKGSGKPRDRDAEEKEAADLLAKVQTKGGSVTRLNADAESQADGPINPDPELVKKVILAAAQAGIDAEPQMTKDDTIVGDGDAGETLAQVAKAVQKAVSAGKIDLKNAAGTCLSLGSVIESIMGGTSGAIYALYFAGLVQGLVQGPGKAGQPAGKNEWGHAALAALENLGRYTPARPGDRTLVDTLDPFCRTLGAGKSLSEAVKAAQAGCENTKNLTPRLGRSTYVSGDIASVADPGATGVAALVKALEDVLG